jgi:ketosteroid isomerase-like protein
MERQTFTKWLEAYKHAWENRDGAAAAALFADDARYHWGAFSPPLEGRAAIEARWNQAVADERDITFTYRIAAVDGQVGVNYWHTVYTHVDTGVRMEYDGVFIITLNDAGLCARFEEWWAERQVEAG